MTHTQTRRVDNAVVLDGVVAGNGAIALDELDLILKSDFEPGQVLKQWGTGDSLSMIRVTEGTTPNDQVIIFDLTGRPRVMTRELALLRLRKRYTHGINQGKAVFYPRPPVERAVPTIECRVDKLFCNEGRGKLFDSEANRDAHERNRHPETFANTERARTRLNEERQIAAQERTAALMERILAGGQTPPPEAVAVTEATKANGNDGSRGPLPDGEPTDQWQPKQITRWLAGHSKQLPEGHEAMSSADLVAYIEALKE